MLRVVILCAVKNTSINPTYIWFLSICGPAPAKLTFHELCSTVVFTIEKKSEHKWTHAVQTHIKVQLNFIFF